MTRRTPEEEYAREMYENSKRGASSSNSFALFCSTLALGLSIANILGRLSG